MNNQFDVNYTIYTGGGASLNMRVNADSPSQARMIVESMFRGQDMRVNGVTPA